MARKCTDDHSEETLLIHCRDYDEGDEEEEALSLSDLPVTLSTCEVGEFRSRRDESSRNADSSEPSRRSEQEDSDFRFDFGIGSSLRAGSDLSEPAEMSTADELFFKGRILPLRHSVSLDAGSTRDRTRFLSRSESVDFRRAGSFASGGSSRSSSYRSHYSSSTTTTATGGGSERKMKNNFINHSQPSPQPQIRRTSSLTSRISMSRNPKSSIWDFLRLGLVRAPEIELQDLKLRTTAGNTKSSVSRNSSCSSTSTSYNSKKTTAESKTRKPRHGFVMSDRKRGFWFGDCKCSMVAETVPLKPGVSVGSVETTAEDEKQKRTKTKAAKTAMARKRTFEWIKELSHAGFVDHGSSLS